MVKPQSGLPTLRDYHREALKREGITFRSAARDLKALTQATQKRVEFGRKGQVQEWEEPHWPTRAKGTELELRALGFFDEFSEASGSPSYVHITITPGPRGDAGASSPGDGLALRIRSGNGDGAGDRVLRRPRGRKNVGGPVGDDPPRRDTP